MFGLLRTYVGFLRTLAATPAEHVADDPLTRGALERYLQLSIQIVLDVGQHVVAAVGLRQPRDYADIFEVLGEGGVLDRDFARQVQAMAGMRNRLVHVYGDLEATRLHEFARNRLDDFDRFTAEVTRYLDSIEG